MPLQGKLPAWVKVPASVALPFGCFEAVLQDEINADISVDFVKLAGFGGMAEEDLSNLASLKEAVQRLRAPGLLKQQLGNAFAEEGVHEPDLPFKVSISMFL
jgi:alpha-glucan,water dikinase